MDFKYKLIASSLLIAFIALFLFGSVSYTSSKELSSKKQISFLHDMNHYLLSSLEIENGHISNYSFFKKHENPSKSENFYIALLDLNNRVLADNGNLELKSDLFNQLPLSVIGKRKGGILHFGRNSFVWATTPSASGRLTLLHSYRQQEISFPQFLATMGIPFGIITLIVIWIGIWAALVINNLFKRINEQKIVLSHQAQHDDLTKLPNRNYLIETIQNLILRSNQRTSFALCTIDLNQFKEINDSLGYQCGNELLIQIGSRLSNILKNADCIARLASDEFAVLFPKSKRASAQQFAEKIQSALEPAFEVDGHSLYVGGTIGVAVYPDHAQDALTLAQRAEIAMNYAKGVHKSFYIYDEKQDKNSAKRLVLINDLRTAIDDGLLELHYQPKLDLQTDSISSVEALVRWTHPEHGPIEPGTVIRMAEKTGLIKPLTQWVLESAIQQCAHWHRRGIYIGVAVNLSAWNFHDTKLEPLINKLLLQAGLSTSSLELEITETAMMSDPVQTKETLLSFAALGIRLSIDDFGTGYSSLSYLKSLPVESIKIDQSFIINMHSDENDASIVKATISLAHDLGLKVIAEGVQDQAALDALKKMGCNTVQGQFISEAVSASELDELLSPTSPVILSSNKPKLPSNYRVKLKR